MYTLIFQFIIKNLPKIILGILISTTMYIGYGKIKSIGYEEAKTEDRALIKQQQELIDTKIASIEVLATNLANTNLETNATLVKDITAIVKNVKGKTLTVIKNGECLPSKTFSDSFVEINKRTNLTIQESQK